MYSIYVHTTPDGRKYVGSTKKRPKKRWRSGKGYLKSHNYVFYNAILKFGWDNIQHEVITTVTSKETALKLEEYYTLLWRTNEPEFGWNIRVGNIISEQTKKKMSVAQKKHNEIKKHYSEFII